MEIIIENGTYKLSGTGLSQTCISTEVLQEDTEYSCQLTFDGTYTSLVHKTVDEIREENGKSVDQLFREVFRW